MAEGNQRQILQVVQNKQKLDNGLMRRPADTLQGFVGDAVNFEYCNGVWKNRLGTRVMNSAENNLWHIKETFTIGGVNIVLGLNYKRELWGWLDKWPEIDFRICNTSPFAKYRHVNSIGKDFFDRHFSFSYGDRFFFGQDSKSVIIANDRGEIFRIMKFGSFRIVRDNDEDTAVLQSTDIALARENPTTTAKIYVDIKNATNKVMNTLPYLLDNKKRKGWRISGETRFAYYNEMGVVSELSEPINLDGYRHVLACTERPVLFDNKARLFLAEKEVKPDAVAGNYSSIISGIWDTSTGLPDIKITPAGSTWSEPNPYPGNVSTWRECYATVVFIKSGEWWKDSISTSVAIEPGIYMCLKKYNSGFINLADHEHTGNFINLQLQTANFIKLKYNFQIQEKNIQTFPRLFASHGESDPMNEVFNTNWTNTGIYGVQKTTMTPDDTTSVWIKLSDDPELKESYKDYTSYWNIDFAGSDDYIRFQGLLTMCWVKLTFDSGWDLNAATWSNQMILGYSFPFSSGTFCTYKENPFDCWEFTGESAVTYSNVDVINATIEVPVADSEVILDITEPKLVEKIKDGSRFAIWNNGWIYAVSQRCFGNGADCDIIYEDEVIASGNYNKPENRLYVYYTPVCSMDYSGRRRFEYPLPLISRAIRNPQKLVFAGSKVYSLEDSGIWYGSISDMMLKDRIDIQANVFDAVEFDEGILVSTSKGLFFISDAGIKAVHRGEGIIPQFLSACSGGAIAVKDGIIYIVHKTITDTGAWYPQATRIGDSIINVNFDGSLKSVSINNYIYLADNYNVWAYDIDAKTWSLKFTYGSKIHKIFVFNGKLGIDFDADVDRSKSFDAPHTEAVDESHP